MILHDQRNSASLRDCPIVLDHPVVVGYRFGLRRNHHRIRPERFRHLAQAQRCTCTAVAGADDDGHAPRRLDRGLDELLALAVEKAVGLAEHAENGDAVHAQTHHEADQAIEGFEVEAFVVVKGRGKDGINALERDWFGHRCAD
jgi:hypothetical protein